MTPREFIRKWRPVALTERQTAQEHFIDLCRLVGHPTPVEADASGEAYCFEKGALKSSGNPGFADVWKKGYFAFEYKKKKKNLGEALKQLSQYAWNLENPPLHVVCDTNLIRIVTAWTNTTSKTFDLSLDDLATPEKFAILHAVFHDPEKLRGHITREMLTKEAADKKLDELRNAWLNPPDLVRSEPEVVPGYPDRILPKDADAARTLKTRILTNLYNERPQWLTDAHEVLDRAVAAAYGWPEEISTDEALEKLLTLDLFRASPRRIAWAS